MRKFRFTIVALIFAFSFSLKAAYAVSCGGAQSPCTLLDASSIVSVIINIVLIVSGIVFFFMLVLSGFNFITANGDTKKIDTGKKSLFFSVIGFALVFLPYFTVPLIVNIAHVKSGLTVNNGNIQANLNSSYTATPLPSYLINTQPVITVPTTPAIPAYVPGEDFSQIIPVTENNDNGCPLNVVAGVPIFQQDSPTDRQQADPDWDLARQRLGKFANQVSMSIYEGDRIYKQITFGYKGTIADATEQKVIRCHLWGEYDSFDNPDPSIGVYSEPDKCSQGSFGYACYTCFPSSFTAVLNTWLNRSALNGGITIAQVIPELRNFHTFSGGFDTVFGDPLSAGRFAGAINAANAILKDNHINLQMKGIALNEIPGAQTMDSFNRVAQAANAGYPVILGMKNHFVTLLSVKYDPALKDNIVTNFDSGGLTADSGHYQGWVNDNGTMSTRVENFLPSWEGWALIMEPTTQHGTF